MNKLDRHDLAIVAALQKDGCMTITVLPEQVGLSSTSCQIRLRRLLDPVSYSSLRAHES